jgi:hypothetical protein
MSDITIEITEQTLELCFPQSLKGEKGDTATLADIIAALASLNSYNTNDAAVAAGKTLYYAGSGHETAARGTLLKTF